MKKLVTLVICAFTLSGCMSGAATGLLRGEGIITAKYEQGMSSDTWTITLPDGEIFKGSAVMVDSTSSFGNTFGTANFNTSGTTSNVYGDYGNAQVFTQGQSGTATMNASTFLNTTSGNFKAVLLGTKGNSITCKLNYADSSGLTNFGGVGTCLVSDGRMIDLTW